MAAMFRFDAHPIIFSRPRLSHPYSWAGHIPFAYLVVDLLRPSLLVELGTHSGNSYLAFCQAVNALGLDTRCTAVDTWEGDAHAGQYDDAVLSALRRYHDPLYSHFSTLSKKLFDHAVADFEDASIDLLHIDGLHTYDAVRHDFETWLKKLSNRGVVLLHDAEVHERDFGVYRFVEEIATKFRTFRFTHSNGLAVVEVGSNPPEAFKAFMDYATAHPTEVRTTFEAIAGTLVEPDGQPARAGAMFERKPVGCRLYARRSGEEYREDASMQVTVDDAAGLSKLRFELPVGLKPDFLRVDFSQVPGLYSLVSARLMQPGGGACVLEDLRPLVRRISGDMLAPRASGQVRLACFDDDPHLELQLDEVLTEFSTDTPITVELVVDYEAVIDDPALMRLVAEAAAPVQEARERRGRVLDIEAAVRASEARIADLSARIGSMNGAILAFNERQLHLNEVLTGTTSHLQHLSHRVEEADARAMQKLVEHQSRIEAFGEMADTHAKQIGIVLEALPQLSAASEAQTQKLSGLVDTLLSMSAAFNDLAKALPTLCAASESQSQKLSDLESMLSDMTIASKENAKCLLALDARLVEQHEMISILNRARPLQRLKRLLGLAR